MSDTDAAIERPPAFQTHVFPLAEKYRDDAFALWNHRFGADEEFAGGWLDDSFDEDSPVETFVAVQGVHVIGFSVCTLADADYANEYVGLDVDDFEPSEKPGVLHMLAVDEDRTGEGTGTKLALACMNYLAGEGADSVIAMSWHRENEVDSRPLFEKLDFERVDTFERYYARTHGRPDCPDCTGECDCTASLYRRVVA